MRDAPDDGDDQGGGQGDGVEFDAMHRRCPFHVLDVHEVLEQLHERDADHGQRHLDLENSGIDVVQPLRPITRIADFQPPDEDLVVALDDHDQQVGHHGDVDQADHHDHDLLAVQGGCIADQVVIVDEESDRVNDQGAEETDVDRVKNPAGLEDGGVENLDGPACRAQNLFRCWGRFLMMVCHISSFESVVEKNNGSLLRHFHFQHRHSAKSRSRIVKVRCGWVREWRAGEFGWL